MSCTGNVKFGRILADCDGVLAHVRLDGTGVDDPRAEGDLEDAGIFGIFNNNNIEKQLGSGCGSVGRAVASDTRDPRFESSHQQILFTIN